MNKIVNDSIDYIINKATAEEKEVIKQHPFITFFILVGIQIFIEEIVNE